MLLLWRLFQWASMANALVLMEKHEGANTWWCFTRSIHCHRSSHAMPFSLASLALCISLPLIHSHTFVINIISVSRFCTSRTKNVETRTHWVVLLGCHTKCTTLFHHDPKRYCTWMRKNVNKRDRKKASDGENKKKKTHREWELDRDWASGCW